MCLELSDKNLASSSNDNTIIIWYFNKEEDLYEKLLILNTNPDIIVNFIETNNKILICSSFFNYNYHIQFWDIENYDFLELLIILL